MQIQLRVPKQTDSDVISAFGKVAKGINQRTFWVRVTPPHSKHIDLDAEKDPEKRDEIQFVLSESGRILSSVQFVDRGAKRAAANYTRQPDKPFDQLDVGNDSYIENLPENERSQFYIKLLSACRREFRVSDAESSFDGLGEKPWTKYLESQRGILNALQETTQNLLTEAARRNDEFEAARRKKLEQMEEEFRAKAAAEREKLDVERKRLEEQQATRTNELQSRIDAFNTKEARYVARQKQAEQIDQLKSWLDKWNLTAGTVQKRSRVEAAYITGAAVALTLTGVATVQNYQLISAATDVTAIMWWHWLAMTVKSVIPFAMFVTLLTYYIRWNGAWARQHAEEEFRNRARVIDIGRSGWLLEAVRDAQDNKQIIPTVLLRELSRNLFAASTSPDADDHPKSVNEMITQGLKTVSVTSADGSKFKVSRK